MSPVHPWLLKGEYNHCSSGDAEAHEADVYTRQLTWPHNYLLVCGPCPEAARRPGLTLHRHQCETKRAGVGATGGAEGGSGKNAQKARPESSLLPPSPWPKSRRAEHLVTGTGSCSLPSLVTDEPPAACPLHAGETKGLPKSALSDCHPSEGERRVFEPR